MRCQIALENFSENIHTSFHRHVEAVSGCYALGCECLLLALCHEDVWQGARQGSDPEGSPFLGRGPACPVVPAQWCFLEYKENLTEKRRQVHGISGYELRDTEVLYEAVSEILRLPGY